MIFPEYFSCCKAFKSSQCLLGEHSKKERERQGDGGREERGKGGWQSANRNRNGKTCVSRKQKAESRERKAETELKAKHAKHDACQKLQVASCALSHAPQSPTSPCLLTVCSCICQCMCLRVRVRVRVCLLLVQLFNFSELV